MNIGFLLIKRWRGKYLSFFKFILWCTRLINFWMVFFLWRSFLVGFIFRIRYFLVEFMKTFTIYRRNWDWLKHAGIIFAPLSWILDKYPIRLCLLNYLFYINSAGSRARAVRSTRRGIFRVVWSLAYQMQCGFLSYLF